MFGRQKKLPPPPKPPTVEQIIEDLETFKEDVHENEFIRQIPPDSKHPERDFWHIYQTFVEDNKVLQTTYNTLEQMKYALQSTVSEVKEVKERVEEDVAKQKEKLTTMRPPPPQPSES